jgi:hypothetical protein
VAARICGGIHFIKYIPIIIFLDAEHFARSICDAVLECWMQGLPVGHNAHYAGPGCHLLLSICTQGWLCRAPPYVAEHLKALKQAGCTDIQLRCARMILVTSDGAAIVRAHVTEKLTPFLVSLWGKLTGAVGLSMFSGSWFEVVKHLQGGGLDDFVSREITHEWFDKAPFANSLPTDVATFVRVW